MRGQGGGQYWKPIRDPYERLNHQWYQGDTQKGYGVKFGRRITQAALEALDGHVGAQIILLVSDINMPGMTGLEPLPVVKQRRPDLPVFMISA
jgi:CheY-like chemotaxis protein